MAAGVLPEPGSKYGPCLTPCQHRDCALTRQMAFSACSICAKPIGYDTRFYESEDREHYDHAACLEDSLDRTNS